MIFDKYDRAEMRFAVWAIGIAASKVRCEVCGYYADTVSPCALCNATRYTTGRI
jgi:hypothetical protein